MRNNRIWARILGVENTVVEAVEFDDDEGCVVVSVRPRSRARSRCGMCQRRCPGYDNGPLAVRYPASLCVITGLQAPTLWPGRDQPGAGYLPSRRHSADDGVVSGR